MPIYDYGYGGRDDLNMQMQLMQSLIAQCLIAITCNTSGVQNEVFEPLRRFQSDGGVVVCYSYGEAPLLDCDQVLPAEGESFELATCYLLGLGHWRNWAFQGWTTQAAKCGFESLWHCAGRKAS